MEAVDHVRLNFNQTSLQALSVVLGLVMFGVALDLTVADFRRVLREPRGPVVGLLAQFLVLPAVSFGLTLLLRPPPSVALGMMLVAACPGGNISNFLTHLAGGRTVLSISMTAVSTAAALFMTPFNVAFWGGLNPQTRSILTDFRLDPVDMLGTVALLLGIPLVVGMLVAARAPALAARLRKPFKILSVGFFFVFVALAINANRQHFAAGLPVVFMPVLIQNTVAFALGYGMARVARLPSADARAVSIEVGIQNSGLGLVLVFGYFGGLGGMAVTAAWWGIWHVVAGMSLAFFWARRPHALQQVAS